MTQPNLSGVEVGRLHAERLEAYLQSLKAEGKSLPSRNGRPNFSAIALACGFDRQVLYKNPACKALLDAAIAEDGLEKTGSESDADSAEKAALEAKVLKLEQHVVALKAEVEGLRCKLRKFSHIEEHLIETGRRIIP
jgi:uncharacterized protein YceH (UPF0502 family)